jgi:type II secretory pathway pseudopilin PulG
METDESVRREALLRELSEVENRTMWSAQGQFEQAKGWQSLNLWLGSLASGCAAVSGALVLSSSGLDILGGVLALIAAAGVAVLTVVNASQRATKATAAANAYLEIQNAARRARLVDAPWMDDETWKYANTSGAKVSSFYLEMRAAQRMAGESSFIPYLDFAYLAGDLANNGLADMNDPTRLPGRFRAASTENFRSTAVTMLTSDAKRVADAIELEKVGRRSEAFTKLAYVFVGTAFPSQFY